MNLPYGRRSLIWEISVVGDRKETDFEEVKLANKAKMDPDNKRKGARVTCGADVVIKNVMPFLTLE